MQLNYILFPRRGKEKWIVMLPLSLYTSTSTNDQIGMCTEQSCFSTYVYEPVPTANESKKAGITTSMIKCFLTTISVHCTVT